jgi:hypothetical protein
MRSLMVCRRTNIERHVRVRGRTFCGGGVARSAFRRLTCGFARVKRPTRVFNADVPWAALRARAAVAGYLTRWATEGVSSAEGEIC